jgi:hypothetical protein
VTRAHDVALRPGRAVDRGRARVRLRRVPAELLPTGNVETRDGEQLTRLGHDDVAARGGEDDSDVGDGDVTLVVGRRRLSVRQIDMRARC